ncbi:XRE family transcriptional regulator [Collimonas antrihumi]|uniref:XRE family transcriptional regulator n=1 Tax=Collimonas antrihumi TaxID=1940615 RepID=UPI001B8AEDDA|nr:XRE family transcriptional regulator [Collimonas antrihumi]
MQVIESKNSGPVFNGTNLRLARSCHNYTLNDVAEAVGKSRQFIHRLEAGRDVPTQELSENLANFLEVYPEFFFQSAGIMVVEDAYHFRKKATTKVASKQSALAKGELFRRYVAYIDSKLRLPDCSFPSFEATTPADIERAAEKCRTEWGLGFGPIDNMVRVAEHAGAVVTSFHDVSHEVDALSFSSARPVIVTNNAKGSACRVRFDLAHEVGHFILHEGKTTGDRLTESEANRFAGAFLLPRSSFVKEFPAMRGSRLNWPGIAQMKLRWKVSKAAILYRARQLDLITESQYKSGIIFGLRRNGEATTEEYDDVIAYEEPELIRNSLEVMSNAFGMTHEDVARQLHMKMGIAKHFLPKSISPELPEPDEKASEVFDLAHYRNRRSLGI